MVSILVVSAAGNVSIENHFLVVLLGGSHRAVVVVIRAVVSSLPNSPDSKMQVFLELGRRILASACHRVPVSSGSAGFRGVGSVWKPNSRQPMIE